MVHGTCRKGWDYFFPEERHIQHHADDSEDQGVDSHEGRFHPVRNERTEVIQYIDFCLIHMLSSLVKMGESRRSGEQRWSGIIASQAKCGVYS